MHQLGGRSSSSRRGDSWSLIKSSRPISGQRALIISSLYFSTAISLLSTSFFVCVLLVLYVGLLLLTAMHQHESITVRSTPSVCSKKDRHFRFLLPVASYCHRQGNKSHWTAKKMDRERKLFGALCTLTWSIEKSRAPIIESDAPFVRSKRTPANSGRGRTREKRTFGQIRYPVLSCRRRKKCPSK